MAGTLYIVATPIGNLSDITLRAVETLQKVDFIAAEDTRVSGKLLKHLGINKHMVSYYEHNQRARGAEIVNRLLNGESCALISDAGTPLISDPGDDLVRECREKNIKVSPIPGACAAVAALSAAGLNSGRFCFEGFLSVGTKKRLEHLESIRNEKRTIIFYESPKKLNRTLRDLYKVLGDRKIVLAREITKIHEEFIPTTLSQARKLYPDKDPKGEFVLIIEGAPDMAASITIDEAVNIMKQKINEGLSASDAAKYSALETGCPRSAIYKQYISEKNQSVVI